jgi:DNA modification methylase
MTVQIIIGDAREKLLTLPEKSVACCVTSPPYFGLRDYDMPNQMGLEPTPEQYIAGMVALFREVRRVLRDDGTLWIVIGDSYAGSGRGGYPGGKSGLDGTTEGQDNSRKAKGSQKAAGLHEKQRLAGTISRAWSPPPAGYKQKDLIGIPWMLAFALRADGWYLRQDIIWSKPNPMPESIKDRCTKAHEYIFLFSKRARYHYDDEAVAEKAAGEARETRNKRSVWRVASSPFAEAHFATYPPALIEPCILAGCPLGGTVLDPFAGAGTTGLVSEQLGRNTILIEINAGYADMARRRIRADLGRVVSDIADNHADAGPLFSNEAA